MVEFKSKLNEEIKNLQSHFAALQKNLKPICNPQWTMNDSFADFDADPNKVAAYFDKNLGYKSKYKLNIEKAIQEYSSDKATLLRIAQYCKLKGLYNKLSGSDREGHAIKTGIYTYQKDVRKSILGFEFGKVQKKTVSEPIKDTVGCFFIMEFGKCNQFSNEVNNLLNGDMSKLSVSTAKLSPNYKLQLDDVVKLSELVK